MGFFSRGREHSTEADPTVECPHGTLIPRWDNATDLGKEDKVSAYMCESCNAMLLPDDVRGSLIDGARI